MILSAAMLSEKLNNYSDQAGKIMRMKKNGDIIPLVRGIYTDDKNIPAYLLAGTIYGPSYISFDYALSLHGLIPEAVYTVTSATFEKKKIKEYNNYFGHFYYHDIPSEAYPFGISVNTENEYHYLLATPEKALCDKLYIMPPVTSQKDIETMLFDDLRIDRVLFYKLNFEDIFQIEEKYHSNNIKYLAKYLRRFAKHE
jgi:hypothetical protein